MVAVIGKRAFRQGMFLPEKDKYLFHAEGSTTTE
jgi:hypothetical protein